MNFLAEYRRGQVGEADIKRYMQEWAAAPIGSPAAQLDLWDYLGMTLEQFRHWIGKGELPPA